MIAPAASHCQDQKHNTSHVETNVISPPLRAIRRQSAQHLSVFQFCHHHSVLLKSSLHASNASYLDGRMSDCHCHCRGRQSDDAMNIHNQMTFIKELEGALLYYTLHNKNTLSVVVSHSRPTLFGISHRCSLRLVLSDEMSPCRGRTTKWKKYCNGKRPRHTRLFMMTSEDDVFDDGAERHALPACLNLNEWRVFRLDVSGRSTEPLARPSKTPRMNMSRQIHNTEPSPSPSQRRNAQHWE